MIDDEVHCSLNITKDFAVLVWREGPRVDVDVGINFDGCDADSVGFEDGADAAGYYAFTDSAYHSSSY